MTPLTAFIAAALGKTGVVYCSVSRRRFNAETWILGSSSSSSSCPLLSHFPRQGKEVEENIEGGDCQAPLSGTSGSMLPSLWACLCPGVSSGLSAEKLHFNRVRSRPCEPVRVRLCDSEHVVCSEVAGCQSSSADAPVCTPGLQETLILLDQSTDRWGMGVHC